MSAYVVRLIGNKEFVGIIVARSHRVLIDLVDEYTDVGACEYARLPEGAVYAQENAPAFPFTPPADPDADWPDLNWFEEHCFSESWCEIFHGYADRKLRWKPLDRDGNFIPGGPFREPKP